MEYSIYLTREKKRTSDINLRAYNNRKGARGGNQGDSNERSKTCSFHDEKTVKYRYSWFIERGKKKERKIVIIGCLCSSRCWGRGG